MRSRERLDEVSTLQCVVLKHATAAFQNQATLAAHWQALGFTAEPDFARAVAEYDAFAQVFVDAGVDIHWLPPDSHVGPDSLYVRDASALVGGGVVTCAMGKRLRMPEPAAQREALGTAITVVGRIEAPGTLEGGDVLWLDPATVAVGRGYRTNDEGIRQFARLAGPSVTTVTVPLPHWRGPGDVFHLMSVISPVDYDLAVVYSPLLPVPFRELLLERGWQLVEVPDAEFQTMGANVLALGPRRCLLLAGNPETRRRLEARGAEVVTYLGNEISVKGGGGPTCLTRPVVRGS